jgi:hypothetical protein
VTAGALLASIGNVGLLACAALTTAGVIAYAWRARGGEHGAWWRSPFGLHLMGFMAAFALVLDQSAAWLLSAGSVLVPASPLRPDWFAWERTLSFAVLIPAVLAWRLWIIIRPPSRLGACNGQVPQGPRRRDRRGPGRRPGGVPVRQLGGPGDRGADRAGRLPHPQRATVMWGNWYWPAGLCVLSALFVPPELFALLTNPANTLSDYCWRELGVSRAMEISAHGAAWWASLVAWLLFVAVITAHIWWRQA